MTQNEQLAAGAKIAEKSTNAVAVLQNQISVLEKENAFLRAQIIQFGIDAAASSGQKQPSSNQLLNSSLAQSLLSTVATQSPPSISAPPPQQSPPQTSNGAAQQLLLSLAQNLTNSPLLTSLAQQQLTSSPLLTSPAQNQLTASPLLTSLAQNQATAAASSLLVSPAHNQGPSLAGPPSQLEFGGTVVIPSLAQPSLHVTPSQLSSISPLLQTSLPSGPSSNPNTPLLSSLVQTLSSMANTTTSPSSSPIPKSSLSPQSSNGGTGLSAAAAASLLNTLIIAQNVLSGTGAPGASSTEGLTMETVEQVPQQ